MSGEHSVSWWIRGLKHGDEDAAARLWERYFERIVRLARARLKGAPRRVADEEDVALSAFRSLCAGAERSRFPEVESRDDLWRLLATITARKAVDQIRHLAAQKRGGGQVRGDSLYLGRDEGRPAGLDGLVGKEPTPEFLYQMAEERERLLETLDDEALRRLALWKMDGLTNEEIALRMDLTPRSVTRKVRRIRESWSRELDTWEAP